MSFFEFDPAKSQINYEKHGIDFIEAQKLWDDRYLLEFDSKAEGERRYIVVGRLEGKSWTAIYTWRSMKIRLISVRRARRLEAKAYEENIRHRV